MADDYPRDKPHILLNDWHQSEPYRRPRQVMESPPLPVRDRQAHAHTLERSILNTIQAAGRRRDDLDLLMQTGTPGYYVEIEVPAAERAVIDQLADRRQRMEVVSVRTSDDGTQLFASVFVPVRAEEYYLNKVRAYRSEDTPNGRPKNEPLVSRINSISLASAKSLFTDSAELFPQDTDTPRWFEVWLRDGQREAFEGLAAALNLQMKAHAIRFPEREVVLVLASVNALQTIIDHSDTVAELRFAKDTPAFFVGLDAEWQREWAEDTAERMWPLPPRPDVAVCVLDSGVNREHPLLRPLLDRADWHTIQPHWGANDSPRWLGHGTAMAGIAALGDLTDLLIEGGDIEPELRLESVRILPPAGEDNEPDLYGAIVEEAVARAEAAAPLRQRVSVLAITSENSARGRPSSWSSSIDQLCYDDENKRLMILSAGNIRDEVLPGDHPDQNDLSSVEDPGQAWNALTVGAMTDKVNISDPDSLHMVPFCAAGEVGPRSRTSVTWQRQWPIKPEIVLEGGNLAHDGVSLPETLEDLQLLTTYYRPLTRQFTVHHDTSAASALAANMAGRIMVSRPDFWPETVRGLMVHSAEWTPAMQAHVDACEGNKSRIAALLRRYGYGVPDLDRALRSTRNDLTLLVQSQLSPFVREAGASNVKTREMNLHVLPWPKAVLEELGEASVQMRVTLSYFIEPNPGERGWTKRHRYASHGLRFKVKTATEELDEFRARINDAVRDEEEGVMPGVAGDDNWLIGTTARDVGSVHSDYWLGGTARDLAERDAIGVYPVGGWWKEKPHMERFDTAVRYALIVTLRTPGAEVDIYTPVDLDVAIATLV